MRLNHARVWLGGIVGGVLLLNTTDRVFRELVPLLILLAAEMGVASRL